MGFQAGIEENFVIRIPMTDVPDFKDLVDKLKLYKKPLGFKTENLLTFDSSDKRIIKYLYDLFDHTGENQATIQNQETGQ